MINPKTAKIEIPIYFSQDEETKEVFIDEDSIKEELENDLKLIQEKPEKYLCVEL